MKFNAKHEFEYVQNFKVLQSVFAKHKIDNDIPVERLIKCKMQDNLEFLQMIKKYWDQYYPGGNYDAVARRKGVAESPAGSKMGSTARLTGSSASLKKAPAARSTSSLAPRAAVTKSASKQKTDLDVEYQVMIEDLSHQTTELKASLDQVEKEREFYFNKLREIEVFVNNATEGVDLSVDAAKLVKDIQDIMYKTEDGFEVPNPEAVESF